jgi:hypothetical protein
MIWLKEGDACTRFFNLKANNQSRKKFIPCLRNKSEEYVWAHDGKVKIMMRISLAYWEMLNRGFLQ